MNTNKLLYYDCVSQFRINYFQDLLTIQNLVGGEIRIDKLSFPDSGTEENANFWGYVLEKNGVKYLLPSKTNSGKNIDVSKMFPIMAKDLQKAAYRGNVYWIINKPIPARFKSEKKLTFRQLVDTLTSFEHTNPDHQKLMAFIGLTSMLSRANFRISTPPGFGKDSVVDILGNLFGNAATIENPTIAKLEYMSVYKWLAINEVIDIKDADWRIIEQFLLSAGAFKPYIIKHSRAKDGVKEVLNISEFSLSLLYNDIDCYKDFEGYIDFIAKKAVLDRFPCLRLHGKLKEDFNSLKNEDISALTKSNEQYYLDLIYTYTYYKENLIRELKNFNTNKLIKLPHRWELSIGRLLSIINLYCESQEEFDKWVTLINSCILDYEEMLNYPRLFINVTTKLVTPNKIKVLVETLKNKSTFSEKNRLLMVGGNDLRQGNDFWEVAQ